MACDPRAGHPEYEPKALARIKADAVDSSAPDAVPVAVVRRTWRASGPSASGAVRTDCLLLACQAERSVAP